MPELPEVETVVRDLGPQLSGRRVESLQLTRDPLIRDRLIRYPTARQFVERLRGRVIASVTRRGKYIVMPLLDAAPGHAAASGQEAASLNGASGQRLIVHLGMTGHLRLWEPEEMPVKEARAPAENRHGGAPRDAASRGRDARRLASAWARGVIACRAGVATPERLSALRSRRAGAERRVMTQAKEPPRERQVLFEIWRRRSECDAAGGRTKPKRQNEANVSSCHPGRARSARAGTQ